MNFTSIKWGYGSSWRTTTAVPDHTKASVELMCFELFPYALVRAGYMKEETFEAGIKNKSSGDFDSGSDAWAHFLGDPTSQGRVSVDELDTPQVQPGDIIVIYGTNGEGIHAVVTSDSSSTTDTLVYSLADRTPTDYLTELTLAGMVGLFEEYGTGSVRAFTLKPGRLA
jgi:hypothetical protein